MCVASMIGDHFRDKYREKPWNPFKDFPILNDLPYVAKPSVPRPTKQEFEDLKKDVQEMKKLLERAIEYDKKNNQPHCEKEDKVEFLRKLAEMAGVSLEDVLKDK